MKSRTTKRKREAKESKNGQESFLSELGWETISRGELIAILENTLDGIVVVDRARKIVFVNPAAEAILGWSREEILGNECSDVFQCHTCSGTTFSGSLCPLLDIFRGERDIDSTEMLINTKTGEERWLEVNYAFLKDHEGDLRYGFSTFRDVTDRKRFAEEVTKAKTLATLGEFASELAHEVKNPLNAIDLHLLLLKRESEKIEESSSKAAFHELISVLNEEVSRLNELVKNFLTFTRSGSLQRKPYDIRVILNDLVELVKFQAQLHRVKVETEYDDYLPLLFIDGDKLKQALLNLIVNGIEAMPDGGILTLKATVSDHHVRLSVRDTGRGIPQDVQDRAFELFYSTKRGGTGIGLPIAQNIVRAHGGTISFEADEPGTEFTITLPLSFHEI